MNGVRTPCDEAEILSKRASASAADGGVWVLVATVLGSSMAFIDSTVVNVALPALQTGLQASGADVQWVVEACALFVSSLLLVGCLVVGLYCRRRVFTAGVLVFALFSVWCRAAGDIRQLI